MPALIDVIIPVFNAADYVRDAVHSIQTQTVDDIRIIVVNDGSTDGSGEILASIAAEDKRVKVLTTPNRGIVDSLNLALEHCDAENIARHDADDLAYPQRFRLQLDHFRDHPGCVAQSGSIRHIDEHGAPVGSFSRGGRLDHTDAQYIPAIEPYLIHPFLMMRRSVVQKAGGYRHVLHSEDTDLYWRLLDFGELHNIDHVLGDYRLHGGSISGSSVRNGRIMALSSQLSALSYQRRRRGERDLEFSAADNPALKAAAGSLQELHALASPRLTPDEQAHLRMALAAKLLELTGYRPYEVEPEDCAFLRAAGQESLRSAPSQNRPFLRRRYSGSVARLMFKGRRKEAMALLWPAIAPATAYRLALRCLFPPGFRSQVKKAVAPRVEALRARLKRGGAGDRVAQAGSGAAETPAA